MAERRWRGLITNADAHDLPPGAAVLQTNLTCVVPGKLTPRKGLSLYYGTGTGRVVNWTRGTIPTAMFRHRGVDGDNVVWQAGANVYISGANGSNTPIETSVDTAAPPCWVQTRAGDLIRVNGAERGSIRIGDTAYPLGITPPATSPKVTTAAGGNSFQGTYYCAYRYRDDHGRYSSLSPLAEVSAAANAKFLWDAKESLEARVTGIEYFRSVADDSSVMYLVGTGTGENPAANSLASRIAVTRTYWSSAANVTIDLAAPLTTAIPVNTVIRWLGSSVDKLVPWTAREVECTVVAAAAVGASKITVGPLKYPIFYGQYAEIAADKGDASEIEDTASDETLETRQALPIYYDDKSLCARRFEPPPENMAVAVQFQDRLFFAVTDTAGERNLLLYSERDEPESVPRSQNALIVQDDQRDGDEIKALFVYGSSLYIAKNRHLYRLSYGYDPRFDGAIRPVCSRGVLHQRAFDSHQDAVYLMDQYGAWKLSGEGPEPISGPVQNYWREGLIDFTKADKFFVAVEPNESIVRFYVCLTTDDEDAPPRALCYEIDNDSWSMDEYPYQLGAACRVEQEGRLRLIVGSETDLLVVSEGERDYNGGALVYQYRSGMMPIPVPDGHRNAPRYSKVQLVLTYQPTYAKETATLRLYWDHDSTPATWFTGSEGAASVSLDATGVTLDLSSAASRLGSAVGRERWPFVCRADKAAITHRFLAYEIEGTVKNEAVEIHALDIEGVE